MSDTPTFTTHPMDGTTTTTIYGVACSPDWLGRSPTVAMVKAGQCPGEHDGFIVLLLICAAFAGWKLLRRFLRS